MLTHDAVYRAALVNALAAHHAMREWIMAVPKDVQLPAMPGIDGDWLDEVGRQISVALDDREWM